MKYILFIIAFLPLMSISQEEKSCFAGFNQKFYMLSYDGKSATVYGGIKKQNVLKMLGNPTSIGKGFLGFEEHSYGNFLKVLYNSYDQLVITNIVLANHSSCSSNKGTLLFSDTQVAKNTTIHELNGIVDMIPINEDSSTISKRYKMFGEYGEITVTFYFNNTNCYGNIYKVQINFM